MMDNTKIDTSKINRLLKQNFNYDSLRPGQTEVISALANGYSAAAIFPTGSGKSICYQLPALFLPKLTLVISPLLALMKDQIDFLNSRRIPAASIDSTQSREQSSEVLQKVRQGEIKILMISVERLKNERFREFIKQIPISLLVIDEAHCISEWGHNFRPDYLKLPAYQIQFNIEQVLLLTATATPKVVNDMQATFSIARENVVSTGFYRQNLHLSVMPCEEADKFNYLGNYLSSHQNEACIIYVTLQKTAQHISQWLNDNGFQSEAYHAGLKSEQREQIQQRFMAGESLIIVATIAFGMGIDKNNIRHVIHYNLPKSIENYAQEIGRAGRDGEISHCLLLANYHGLNVLKNFVYGDTPELYGIKTVLNEITKAAQIPDKKAEDKSWEVLSYPLSTLSNIRLLPLKTLLVYLEIEGIIQAKYSYYAEYKYQLKISEQELLDKFTGERQGFVQAILKHSQKAKTWITLDIDGILNNYPTDRQRIITAVEYFQEKGWIVLESKQMTDVYQISNVSFDFDELAAQLFQKFKQKEQAEIKRIDDMLAMFQVHKCLSQQLSQYFDDNSLNEGCGNCSVCRGESLDWPQSAALAEIQTTELESYIRPLQQAIEDKFSQAASNDLICRFLCGISSPWLTKVRARSLAGFGQYEAYAYSEIYALLESAF